MSLRSSRRSQAAAAAAAGMPEETPSVPIADIRVRKWSKQVKMVGHITIVKWVPEQEHPTEALQRGGFKKTKGRKRPAAEVGRMTRSVRQHLDAPLELLVEMPIMREKTRSSAAQAAVSTAAADANTTAPPASAIKSEPNAGAAMATTASSGSLLAMAGDPMTFTDGVASEEQLEQALDDLPFLDTDNLAMDPALAMDRQAASQQQQQQQVAQVKTIKTEPPLAAQPSPDADASAASAEEQDDAASSSSDSSDDDDDDDDDDDGTASVDSATTPLPSPSPAASPTTSP